VKGEGKIMNGEWRNGE